MNVPINKQQLETHALVERAIVAEARRLCAARCAGARNRKEPCRACAAEIHGWRPDALRSLRKVAP